MTSQWTNPDIEAESAANVAWLEATEAIVKAARPIAEATSDDQIFRRLPTLRNALHVRDALRQAAMERK